MRRRVIYLVAIPVGLYLAALLLVYLMQGRMLFVATQELYRTPEENGWAYDDVVVNVGSESTHGWWIPAPGESKGAPGESKGVFLFSHGNAGNIADRLESVSIFRGMGFDVLVYDYGGYGNSTGKPSEKRCYEDIRAMYRWLIEERGIPEGRIVLFGRSLGAGPTVQLATEVNAAAVVIESAFLSVPRMAQRLYPIFPSAVLTRHRFDNEAKIGRLRSPALFVHSRRDSLIPYEHGERLHELASEPKAFLEIHGEHNEGFWQSAALYTDGITEFITPLIDTE